MSGDDLHAPPRTKTTEIRHETSSIVTPRLLQHVRDAQRDGTPEEVMSTIADDLFDGDVDDVSVSGTFLTQSLDEILLGLIALRDDATHGTGLMEDVDSLFDVDPSPGTVYPRLHGLEAEDILSRHELVQTKQYFIRDDEKAADHIERTMYQHLAIGMFLQAALESL